MTTVNIYLNFSGNCEEAFLFYKSVFGGEFSYLGRFKDIPKQEDLPEISSEDGEKILHVTLPISKETSLMGCDNIGEWNEAYQQGNNFSVSVTTDSREEADRLFQELSREGQVQVPLALAFWGDYYGQFTDKFGINWMIISD
ncbi:VOC family protein [bacterium]|nr:VOC family protein [bacterium]